MTGPEPFQAVAGSRIGRYTIERRLGAGGMGVVYKARDSKLGRAVAIKFLTPDFSDDSLRRDRFLQEARAASNLDHPNLGTLHGIEETPDGQPYLVMTYYDGATLAQMLQRGRLGTDQALDIAIQTARGLREAHAHGILHRDIKPANLILTQQGVVKIVDFGLAKMAGETNLTEPGTVLGTAAYLSPEQARGEASDERADIWSLGVVLYEMLTGQALFSGENYFSVLHAINSKTPDLEGLNATALEPVLRRALEKDVNHRFRTMDEFLRALELTRTGGDAAAETATMLAMPALPAKSGSGSVAVRESGMAVGWARRWRKWAAAGVVVVAAAVLLKVFWPSGEKAVAVLPFVVMGGSSGEVALVDGLQETLTSKLSELERYQEKLWVVPASEVRRSAAKSASDVARAFGANLAVTGSVQRVGAALRLSVNLVDAKTLRQLGSAVLDEPGGDWLRLQDGAVAELTTLLAVRGREPGMRSQGSVPPEAYEAYLKAVGLLQRWDKTKDLSECRRLLEGVVTTAPQFGGGHVVLANAYWTSYTQDNDPTWVEKARQQLSAANSLEPNSAAVHEMMGRIRAGSEQRDLAVLEFQEALKLDPRSQIALSGLARMYDSMGRKAEAEATYQKAIVLRPRAWNAYNGLGTFYYRQRRFSEAEAQFRKGLELTSDNSGLLNNLANSLKSQGRAKEAAAMFQRAIDIEPSYVSYQNFGTFYYQQGDFGRSAQMFEKALALNAKDFRVWGSLGSALIRSGGSVERQRAAFTKAAELGEKLLAAMPSNAENQSLVAEYEVRLGQEVKARQHLVAITPGTTEDPGVWIRVATVRKLLGDRKEAEGAVKMAATYGATQESTSREPDLKEFEYLLPKASRK